MIKKLTVYGLALVLSLALTMSANARTTITVNPLSVLLYGALSGELETSISPQMTATVEGLSWLTRVGPGERISAAGFAIGFRNYPGGTAHQGFYLGPEWVSASVTGTSSGDTVTASVTGISFGIGFKRILSNSFVYDIGASFSRPISTTVSSGGVSETYAGGFLGFSLGAGVGYAF